MQDALWELCERGDLIFHFSSEQELLRMRELMDSYRDTPMDLADASIVVAAEMLNQSVVFTTDSDFYVYRRQGILPFQVII